ncbi:MAG: ATP-binding protein [Candidatus Eisenbacteria bacterium]
MHFPIRFKILLALLAVVSVVVTVITYTMANLFHTDKTAYIHDLTSVMALRAADETRSLLQGYRERLQTYAIVLGEESVSEERRFEMVRELMAGFPECVAITLCDESGEPFSTIYDGEALDAVGLGKDALSAELASLGVPWERLAHGEPFLRAASFSDRLPSFVLVTPIGSGDDRATSGFVCGVLDNNGLVRSSLRSGFDSFICDNRGVLLSHRDPDRVRNHTQPDWLPGLSSLALARGITREFEAQGQAMVGGFASSGFDGVITGVQIPKTVAYLASRDLLNRLLFVALALLLFAALGALLGARAITAPLERLAQATRRVGRGEFDVQVEVAGRDEIGGLASSFNRMASELEARDTALHQAQAQLVQSEKMAAFGQLGAGIAHEVKNPLAGILGCAQLSLRTAEDGTPLHANLKLIEKETRRCKDIIESLLKFARQEKAELRHTALGPVAEDAATIVRHQLELAQVHLDVEVDPDLPLVLANANQIQQVLMNLMINAQQAMAGEPGRVQLRVTTADGSVPGSNDPATRQIVVTVQDDGPGIPPEHRERIFEPFFTTKPSGVGTGLGLSVSYGIVRDHGGAITVESEMGVGTVFRLAFPIVASDRGEGTGSEAPTVAAA